MKKVSFIGAYDNIDFVLYIAKLLVAMDKRVLLIDGTMMQKAKYIVPSINPSKSYVTEFEGIDVAVGFLSYENIKQYLGVDYLDYDIALVNVDTSEAVSNFDIESCDKNYFVTSFDMYSLKKGTEILTQLGVPVRMKRIFFSKDMLKEEVDYFDYLVLGSKAIFDEEKIYFLLENGDLTSIMENQRISKIKLSNLSKVYLENIEYLTGDIAPDISGKTIRGIIKEL